MISVTVIEKEIENRSGRSFHQPTIVRIVEIMRGINKTSLVIRYGKLKVVLMSINGICKDCSGSIRQGVNSIVCVGS